MGKKIPGKKHRGVKDPEKQRANRLKSVADKINAPPSNPDEQAVTSSLKKIIELKEVAKKPKTKERKKRSLKYVQRSGESDKHFLHRIHLDCVNVIKETAFEEKYKVKIKRDPTTGKVKDVVKADKDELVEYLKKIKKEKKNKSKTKEDKVRLTKSQKRRLKLMNKKKQKENEIVHKEQKDVVKFGEVAHAPPTLTIPKKASNIVKPGKKELLMKSLLEKESIKKSNNKVTKVIDKKSKRKLLPVALRRQLEKDQKHIVEAYRQLKCNKKNSGCIN